MATELTEKQLDVLRFVAEHLEGFGSPPTQQAISSYMNFSSRTAARGHLISLENKGMLLRTKLGSRNLQLTDKGRALLRSLREQQNSHRREVSWENGTRVIIIERSPGDSIGLISLTMKHHGHPSKAALIELPTMVARQLASEIQDLVCVTKPFTLQFAEDEKPRT